MNPIERLVGEAVEVLERGGVVLIPTDTVYGLAALAADSDAVEKLFALKDRPLDRTIAVLIATWSQAESLAQADAESEAMARHFWPGALTMVLPARADAPKSVVSDQGGIGLRRPDSLLVRSIAELAGPLAVTSANRAGRATPSTAHRCCKDLSGTPDLVIDGGEIPGTASTVIERHGDGWSMLREGPITRAQIAAIGTLVAGPQDTVSR